MPQHKLKIFQTAEILVQATNVQVFLYLVENYFIHYETKQWVWQQIKSSVKPIAMFRSHW